MKPLKLNKWKIEAFADSDFCGDRENQRSVTGFIVFVNKVAVSWRSKSQNNVSLSTTKAEYVAVSEVANEIKFLTNLLDVMKVEYEKPIKVNIDNVRALFLIKNMNTSERTRHIDSMYHFTRELTEEGLIKVEFIKSEDNMADIFTKSLNTTLNNKHKRKFMTDH
jgi:hypothetical protein